MSDLPSYDYDSNKTDGDVKLNKENADGIMNFINTMS